MKKIPAFNLQDKKTVRSTTTEYTANTVYNNGTLELIFMPEGYIEPTDSGYDYIYRITDHLGNTRVSFKKNSLTENIDVLATNDYYPFGLEHQKAGTTVESSNLGENYKFNGVELNEDLGLNFYEMGFRQYDPSIGRFTAVDPLADLPKQVGTSPYAFVNNNPIGYVDPTGMSWSDIRDFIKINKKINDKGGDDDYKLDKNGNITLLRETDDKTDKLIAFNDKGNETDKSVEVEKGVLNNVITDKDSKGISYDYMKVNNNETATKLFEFVAENSQVEWSQVKYGTKSNFISTSHDPIIEFGGVDLMYGLLTKGYTVREHIHSHPNRELNYYGPSGFHPRDKNKGDRSLGEWINKYYPSKGIKLKVYEVPLKKYIKYNHKGIIIK